MNTARLHLHCGASSVSRERVAQAITPERTDSWVPIAHDRLLNGVQESLARSGLHVVTEAHGLTHDSNRYFGLLQVANGSNPDDFGLVVGIRNSHDKTFPAALVLGASVFVCDNLSFSGEVKLARKHTAYIERDLPQLVDRAVGLLCDLRHTQERRFEAYRNHELADSQAHDLIIQGLDSRVVPVTRIPELLQEWREPRHAEFREGRTAWRLFNAFTEILKGNLGELPRRTQALHGLMDSACGLVRPQGYRTEDAEIQIAAAV
ncbi:MAG TPA: DUF932 domain-containing protein [Gemmataceae bacterium]|nr:DUF932 domain-containing protein [Gemmataceae bacterium]